MQNQTAKKTGGKAAGLIALENLANTNIPPFISIPADAQKSDIDKAVIAFLISLPPEAKIAVRSSALSEDSKTASFAGAFSTQLNLPPDNKTISDAAVDIMKQGNRKLAEIFNRKAQKETGVVIQQMVDAPDFAGVCLSHPANTQEDAYLLVNYRRGLGDKLVSGEDNGETVRILRHADLSDTLAIEASFLPALVRIMHDIERHMGNQAMDVEFAVKNGTVHILQARPLVGGKLCVADVEARTTQAVKNVTKEIEAYCKDDILGDMIDINPRELLGDMPENINVKIFKDIFADGIVEKARGNIGYAPLYTGLLRQIGGKPYVSLNASAHSLRPQNISFATYDKMVTIYKEELRAHPDLQDKVEFDLYVTNERQARTFVQKHTERFSVAERIEITGGYAALDRRLQYEMHELSYTIETTLDAYKKKVSLLDNNTDEATILSTLQEGTALFVKAARLAFYARASYDAQHGTGSADQILRHVKTPAAKLAHMVHQYQQGEIVLLELMQEFGHVRPGQMDIYATPLRQTPERLIDTATNEGTPLANTPTLTKEAEILLQLFSARENIKHEFMKAFDKLAERISTKGMPRNAHHVPIVLPAVLTKETSLTVIMEAKGTGNYFGHHKITALPIVVDEKNVNKLKPQDVKGKILILDRADPGYDFLLSMKPAGIVTRVGGPASHIALRVNELGIPACIGCGIDPAIIQQDKPYCIDPVKKQHGHGIAVTLKQKRVKNDFHPS